MILAGVISFFRRTLPLVVVLALFAIPASADTLNDLIPPQNTNLAVGGAVTSSGGWGGGSYPWQLTDGQRGYSYWANGLAFYWDSSWKWAAVTFDAPTTFNMVVLWHHSQYHGPSNTALEYWNGSAWIPITVNQRQYDIDGTQCTDIGSSCDIYSFDAVTGSAVRWSFDPGQYWLSDSPDWIAAGPAHHGWLYEFEVYNAPSAVPEPATLLLVGTGLAFVRLRKKSGAA
jgi:hypothetical protein